MPSKITQSKEYGAKLGILWHNVVVFILINLIMSDFLKKLKKLVQKDRSDSKQDFDNKTEQEADDVGMAHLHPVSTRIEAWLDGHGWRYHHVKPEKDDLLRTHLFILGFHNDDFDWRCVIRIHEKNHLMCFLGMPENPVPKSHRLAALVLLSQMSLELGYGSFELDLDTGEARTKLSIDAEYRQLSTQALDVCLYNLTDLVGRMIALIDETVSQPASPLQEAFLAQLKLTNFEDGYDNDEGYFVPTHEQQ